MYVLPNGYSLSEIQKILLQIDRNRAGVPQALQEAQAGVLPCLLESNGNVELCLGMGK